MTNEELKKKIVEVVLNSEITGIQIRAITGGYSMANNIADALISAGIGDVTEWKEKVECAKRILQIPTLPNGTTDLSYFEYKGERIQDIARQRDEYKHRAEVAEKQVYCLARSFAEAMCKYSDDTHYLVDGFIQDAYSQAEKELAEERKDD